MIPALGAGGPGFESRFGPSLILFDTKIADLDCSYFYVLYTDKLFAANTSQDLVAFVSLFTNELVVPLFLSRKRLGV
jgi:hypothetical protein